MLEADCSKRCKTFRIGAPEGRVNSLFIEEIGFRLGVRDWICMFSKLNILFHNNILGSVSVGHRDFPLRAQIGADI